MPTKHKPKSKPVPHNEAQDRLNECKPLKYDLTLVELYRKAYSEKDHRDVALQNVARHVLKMYYVNVPPNIPIEIGPPDSKTAGSVTCEPNNTQPIKIPSNTFDQPAELVITIGHELIHQIQCRRQYGKVRQQLLENAIGNLREVEAYSWEVAPTGFSWDINGKNHAEVRACLSQDYFVGAQKLRDEYQSKLKESILNLKPRKDAYFSNLQTWMATDPWVKDVWLKSGQDKQKNADWQSWGD